MIAEIKGYAWEGFTYCVDCANTLDTIIVAEGEIITNADLTIWKYGRACDECKSIIIIPDDGEFEDLISSIA